MKKIFVFSILLLLIQVINAQDIDNNVNIQIYSNGNVISSTMLDSIVFNRSNICYNPENVKKSSDNESCSKDCNCCNNNTIGKYTGVSEISDFEIGYIPTASTLVNVDNVVNNYTFMHVVVNCVSGEHFTISGRGGDTPRLWCFIDCDFNVLDVAHNGGNVENQILTAPNNAAYLIANFDVSSKYSLSRGAHNGVYLSNIETNFNNFYKDLQAESLSAKPFEIGTFSPTIGSLIKDESSLRSVQFISPLVKTANCDSEHKIGLYAWTSNNSYLGFWDGKKFSTKNRALAESWDIQTIRKNYPECQIKMVVVRTDNLPVTVKDGDNITLKGILTNNNCSENSGNLIPSLSIPDTNRAGITYHVSDGNIYLSGYTTSNFGLVISDSILGLPKGLIPGERYHVHLANEPISKLYIQVIDGGGKYLLSSQTEGDIIIPEDKKLTIRLYMGSGNELDDVVVTPYLVKNYSNEQLENRINRILPTELPSMLTIIDDDGHPKFKTDILPIIQRKHVSISSANYNLGAESGRNAMTWADIIECYNEGAEILSHTYDHQTSYGDDLSEDDIAYNYTRSRNGMLSRGIYGGRYLVYSGSSGNTQKAKNAAAKVFDLAINSSGNKINVPQDLDKYNIQRYRIETDGYNYDLDALKVLIDNCKNNGGWMVWMFHTSSAKWNEPAKVNLEAAIEYAKQSGLPIVSVDYVYRKYLKNM